MNQDNTEPAQTIESALQYYQSGNLQRAERICGQILRVHPADADALLLLGVIYCRGKNYGLAKEVIERSIQFSPENPYAYFYLGNVFVASYQIDEAITCYRKAIQLHPDFIEAHINLGNSYQGKGRIDEAVACYRAALELDPDYADTYYNLGNALQRAKRFDEAVNYYSKALQLDPCSDVTYYNLGTALQSQGRTEEASAAFAKTLECNPRYLSARWAQCMSQLHIVYPDHSSLQLARKCYQDELFKLRDEMHLESPEDVEIAAEAVGCVQPFYLAYQGFNDRELQQFYGDLVCKIMALRYPQWSVRPAMPVLDAGKSLRIGIVSGYYCNHSVWKIPIEGWIGNLDKKKFSLYGYHTGNKKDRETENARQSLTRFVEDVSSFEELCRIIRDDDLHVLIYPEIGMDTVAIRLATLRLAPVQCVTWGHPDTSGLPTIDYFLSSELAEPPEADEHYTEKLIRLPNLSIHYTPVAARPSELRRDTFGLRPNAVLYHCCQSLYKFLPEYDDIFPRIAQEVRDCQFLFASYPTSSYIIEQFRYRLVKAFKRFGLKADDCVVFLPFLDEGRYQALHTISDIFLDPIGWSGWNCTLEAIAHNLPVVTLPSNLMRGRGTSAILTMMGLKETIASTLDSYVESAARLGKDQSLRSHASDDIASNKCRVYRDNVCVRGLETFLETAVREALG